MHTPKPNTSFVLRLVFQKSVVTTALKIGIVVGTILNLINQGHVITAPDSLEALSYSKLLLTYCVPYLVSTYSSVATLHQIRKRTVESSKSTTLSNQAISS